MNKKQTEVELAKLTDEEKELNRLKAIYGKASEDIQKKIRISDGKINFLLSDFDNLDDKQKSILQSQIYQKQFQESLKKQIDGFMKDLDSKQYKSVKDYMKSCYETGYIGTMYDLHGQGIPLVMPIDQKKVTRAMTHDTKLSTSLYKRLGVDVNLLKKRVANNISRGIATASEYRVIARNIALDHKVGINRAMRIARTEGHRIQVLSAVDAQHDAKDAGADVVKQWNAALDGRTRPHHRMLDGQIRELDEDFEVDGMKVKYPSGFGRASEDINCRCALLQRARWALDEEELNTLKERAEYFGLDKTKDFDDFRKKYLKSSKSLELTNRRKERLAARAAAQKKASIPDFSKMEHSEIVSWAEANLKTGIEGIKGANKEFVKETVQVLAEFENRMGGTIDGLSVKFGGLSGNVYAKYDDVTKTLLLKKTGNLKSFEDKLKAENARYRIKWKRDKDYNATDTYSGTIWHELGHAIDAETGQNLSRRLSGELYERSVKVSAYAGTQQGVRVTKASEAWAENFAAYMAKNANASKVPDEIKEMIEDYFKKSKAKASKSVKIQLKVDNYSSAFTAKAAEKKNTQMLVDYVNGLQNANQTALKLYNSIGKIEKFEANEIKFSISHGKNHAVSYTYNTVTGQLLEVKLTIPKLSGENLIGQVQTTLHEQMHLIDMLLKSDPTKAGAYFGEAFAPLQEALKKTSSSIGKDIKKLFDDARAEYKAIKEKAKQVFNDEHDEIVAKYLPNGVFGTDADYKAYKKEYNKIKKKFEETVDYEQRNALGGGMGQLEDIYDALSGGYYRDSGVVRYGHGGSYYRKKGKVINEIVANYASLSVTRPDLIDMLKKDKPELVKALDEMLEEMAKKV